MARKRFGCAIALTAVTITLRLAAGAQGPAQDVSGIWQATAIDNRVKPADGGNLPFTPQGLAAYQKNIAGLKDGSIKDDAVRVCVPHGVPRILRTPYPFQILQVPGNITILYEDNHVFRNVLMNRPPASDEDLEAYPYYSGTSYGRWDGDTLVIETRGLNDRTFIDATGVPHSDKLHVTERLRKINGGKQLENIVTIEDPQTFTKPWSTRFVYESRPDIVLDTSFTCGEPHRQLSERKNGS
jgi:hypothetical protein